MSPKTKVRAALISIPFAVLIAAWAVILHNWPVVFAMVLLEVAQGLNYRANRSKPD